MSEKNYTSQDIYHLIETGDVGKEVGVNLIENYGYRQQRETIEKLQNEHGGYSKEIEMAISRVNAQLDEMLDKTIKACTHTKGL